MPASYLPQNREVWVRFLMLQTMDRASMPVSLTLLIFSSTSCHRSLAHLLDFASAVAFSILL